MAWLYTLGIDGAELAPSVLASRYGDIAFTPDGALYGVRLDTPGDYNLYRIDPGTGTATGIEMTGAVRDPALLYQHAPQLNGLGALPEGRLLLGAATTSNIFVVDPATGVTTLFPASFPAGFGSGGDFEMLPNGDILAIGMRSPDGMYSLEDPVYRIRPDMTMIRIGTLPGRGYAVTVSGGRVYVALESGGLIRLERVPTVASTAPLPYTTITSTPGGFYGLTSLGDTGCDPALSVRKRTDVAPGAVVEPGRTVTYTLTFDNSAGRADADVAHADDLTDVIDDAEVTVAPALTSGEGLTVGTVITAGGRTTFAVEGLLEAGTTATVTYAVTVNDPATPGTPVLRNFLLPAGAVPRPPATWRRTTAPRTRSRRPPHRRRPRRLPRRSPRRSRSWRRRDRRPSRCAWRSTRPSRAGRAVTVRLTGRNTGGTARGLALCVSLPRGTTIATRPVGGRIARGRVCWSIGTMRPGQRIVRTVRLRIDRDLRSPRIVARASLDRQGVAGVDARTERGVAVRAARPRPVTSRVTG